MTLQDLYLLAQIGIRPEEVFSPAVLISFIITGAIAIIFYLKKDNDKLRKELKEEKDNRLKDAKDYAERIEDFTERVSKNNEILNSTTKDVYRSLTDLKDNLKNK